MENGTGFELVLIKRQMGIYMKYLIFVCLAVNLVFCQTPKDIYSLNVIALTITHPSVPVNYLYDDLNNDGRSELLKGESIIKMNESEYWVKNVEFTSSNGNVYTLYGKLKKNDMPVLKQVEAEYGYILIFNDDSNDVEVYIAGENGNKNSDVIYISMD
jgi:hypothetical protein